MRPSRFSSSYADQNGRLGRRIVPLTAVRSPAATAWRIAARAQGRLRRRRRPTTWNEMDRSGRGGMKWSGQSFKAVESPARRRNLTLESRSDCPTSSAAMPKGPLPDPDPTVMNDPTCDVRKVRLVAVAASVRFRTGAQWQNSMHCGLGTLLYAPIGTGGDSMWVSSWAGLSQHRVAPDVVDLRVFRDTRLCLPTAGA